MSDLRRRILRTALAAADEQGLDGVTMRGVAQRVDVSAMLYIRGCCGDHGPGLPVGSLPEPRPGVRTHMLLMALVRHAEIGRGRRALLGELVRAAAGRGWYAGSSEELLPIRDDPGAALLVGAVATCLLASPGLWRRLAGSGAPPHALTAEGWRQLNR